MSRKQYPCIGSVRKHHKGGPCAACSQRGTYRVDIQVSYMRGDDEVVWACELHKRDLNALTKSWTTSEVRNEQ